MKSLEDFAVSTAIKTFGKGEWQTKHMDPEVYDYTAVPVDTGVVDAYAMKIRFTVTPKGVAPLSALALEMEMDKRFICTYVPHLSPGRHYVIGEKALRGSPIVLEDEERVIAIMPDIDELEHEHPIPYILDYEKQGNKVLAGVGFHKRTGHVYYQLSGEEIEIDVPLTFSFYLLSHRKSKKCLRDYRVINDIIWRLFAEKNMALVPNPNALTIYVDYVYQWAFHGWRDVCWQEFKLGQQTVGGVVFIVTARQKPGLGEEKLWREPKSLWNQAWFCSLRSAYGYYMWGRKTGDEMLRRKAGKSLEFALASPRNGGFFSVYYQSDREDFANGTWGNCGPRRPENHEEYYHLLDCSWTCYWLLKWYEDIERDTRILQFVQEYIDDILPYQQPEGNFPAWVDPVDGRVSPYLLDSPESAVHIILLCKMHKITGDDRLLRSAESAAGFIIGEIMETGRWEDFETYWSCAYTWKEKQFGCVDRKSGLYNQCTFGMYWCAEGLLRLYALTGAERYLDAGERVLAELSFYQQIYRPYDFPVETVGGFGVMNCDDEWNDARQSLFALTYLRYFKQTGKEMYRIKAMQSMSASFYMMYCPENPEVKKLYEKVHPHFDERDYGFHMENFNHHDGRDVSEEGLGEFTIFDWGNGAACSSLYEFLQLYES